MNFNMAPNLNIEFDIMHEVQYQSVFKIHRFDDIKIIRNLDSICQIKNLRKKL